MHTSPVSSALKMALATAVLAVATLAAAPPAQARSFGKKPGWSNRDRDAAPEAKAPRRSLFSRSKQPAARGAATVAVTRSTPVPRATRVMPVATGNRASVPATPAAADPIPRAPRRGLLARIFGGKNRNQAASRAATHGGLRRIDPAPAPKPQRAPGQPNAVQAAPKIDHSLLARSSKSQSSVVVNIASQRAYLYVGGKVAVDTPISTARSGHYTPRGSFRVGERVAQGKISTIYHVEMPYWMRLGSSVFGMHAGYLPGYPASAGCIRMPYAAAQAIYQATGHGTPVKIVSG